MDHLEHNLTKVQNTRATPGRGEPRPVVLRVRLVEPRPEPERREAEELGAGRGEDDVEVPGDRGDYLEGAIDDFQLALDHLLKQAHEGGDGPPQRSSPFSAQRKEEKGKSFL